MYQTIPMSSDVEQQLKDVQVWGIKLELHSDEAKISRLNFAADWQDLHELWKGRSKGDVAQDRNIVAYQHFYDLLGLNHKKTPPSVQNLIQRFLIKEQLERIPLIHPIVDAVNVAALKKLIPLGVFDADCVMEGLRLMRSSGGEDFQPLGSSAPEALDPGVLVLADEEKVLSRFCYRDSEAQKITEQTRRIWLLGCQVPGITPEDVHQALDEAQVQLQRGYKLAIV
ncbi:B3/4 domain protein [compost metagenome]